MACSPLQTLPARGALCCLLTDAGRPADAMGSVWRRLRQHLRKTWRTAKRYGAAGRLAFCLPTPPLRTLRANFSFFLRRAALLPRFLAGC